MTGLNLLNISVRYKPDGLPVLSNISLSVDAQDIVVILGPSGSGKTTLLNLVAGFIKPTQGRLTLKLMVHRLNEQSYSKMMYCYLGKVSLVI